MVKMQADMEVESSADYELQILDQSEPDDSALRGTGVAAAARCVQCYCALQYAGEDLLEKPSKEVCLAAGRHWGDLHSWWC